MQVSTAIGSAATYNLEVVFRKGAVVASSPVGETIVERRIRNHVIARNHENTIIGGNLVSLLRDDVLSHQQRGYHPCCQHQYVVKNHLFLLHTLYVFMLLFNHSYVNIQSSN